MPLLKFFCVSLILKENRPNFSKRHLIKQCNELRQTRLLERCSQACHIGTERDSQLTADQASINIRFNGVCNHQIRTLILEYVFIVSHQFKICQRVDASALNRSVNAFYTHLLEWFFMLFFIKRKTQYHFMFFIQFRYQFPPKLPQHISMICCDQNFLRLPFLFIFCFIQNHLHLSFYN